MFDAFRRIGDLWVFSWQTCVHVIDILLVAYVNYRLLKLIRGTRAWRVIGGVVIFILALFLSDYFQLRTLHWLLDKATVLAPVALVLLLLPELRQALEGFAKLGLWPERLPGTDSTIGMDTLEEIVASVTEAADQRIGALIVLERNTKLDDVAANGVAVHARVSAPLLGAIFYHGNPLHDGAAIVRNDTILAAACRLPLSENPALSPHLHMRHRAGVGISEQTDSVVVIVSEERGVVSVAIEGQLYHLRSNQDLRDLLNREMRGVWSDRGVRRRRRRSREAPIREPETTEAGVE